jgi:hypothetical protein
MRRWRTAARRAAWRLWPDRNPLRRPADRAERLIIAGLLALFAAAAPAVAMAVGHGVAGGRAAVTRATPASWHRVLAHLEQSAPPPVGPAAPSSYLAREPAWWVAPGGAHHRGDLLVPGGAQAGSVIPVWVDRAGRLVRGPLAAGELLGGGALPAAGAVAVLAAILVIAAAVARRSLDRRRLAGWEAAWASVGPEWTGRP